MRNIENIIDCKGLNCPMPVINTKKYFDGIESGTAVVIVDNKVAKNNIEKFAASNGFKFEGKDKENNLFEVIITKGEVRELPNESEVLDVNKEPFTIVIASNELGEGSNELGTALMKSYMFALAEADIIPDNLLFINGGVKLVVEDSLVLDSIKKLKDRGTNVQSCGLCLDFYKIKDKLAVGEITNMYAIIEMMNSSKTIKL